MTTRRRFLQHTASAAACVALPGLRLPGIGRDDACAVPCRAITEPPGHHWFGYYDKLQFSPDDRYALGMRVDFEGRSPAADDRIGIGMVDLEDGDAWIPLGESRAWGWQQGCMLQWRPAHGYEVLWNDRQGGAGGGRFVTRLMDVQTGRTRTLPRPVYAVGPDGRYGVGTDFRRIQHTRPGYGYAGPADPVADEGAPESIGIYVMDLDSGVARTVFSLADAAAIEYPSEDLSLATHWFNHLLVSPSGERLIFLHRWRFPDDAPYENPRRFRTRMFTIGLDGSDPYVLDPDGYTSHFIWDDAERVTMWTKPADQPHGFYRYTDRTRQIEPLGAGVMTQNGHNTYVPGTDNAWILNDTYPDRQTREQTLYLYHVPTDRKVVLGTFYSPPAYTGEWRTDLHPRTNRAGTRVCIDATHAGHGRQMVLLDISDIVNG